MAYDGLMDKWFGAVPLTAANVVETVLVAHVFFSMSNGTVLVNRRVLSSNPALVPC